MKKNILLVVCILVSYSFYAQTTTIDFTGGVSLTSLADSRADQSDISAVAVGQGQFFTSNNDFAVQATGGNPNHYLGRSSSNQFAKGLTYVYNNSNNAVTGTINLSFDYVFASGGGRTGDRISYRVWGIEDTSENDGVNGEFRMDGGSGAFGDNDATNYIGTNTDGTVLASNFAVGIADSFTNISIPVDVTGYEYIVISVGMTFGTTDDTANPENIFKIDNLTVPSSTVSAQPSSIDFTGAVSLTSLADSNADQTDISAVAVGQGQFFTSNNDFAVQATGGNPNHYLGRSSSNQFARGLTYVYNNSDNAISGTINLGFDYVFASGGGRTGDRISYRVWGIEDTSENNGVNGEFELTGGSGAFGDNAATNYIGTNTDGTVLASNFAVGIADSFTNVSFNVDVTDYEYIVISVGMTFGTTDDTANPENIFKIDNFIVPTAPASATTWTGATDTDWATPGNWDNGVPTTSSDVTIPAGLSNYPTVTTAETINSLTIGNGARLVATNAGFTVTNNATYVRSLDTGNRWYLASSPVVGEMYDDDWNTANSIASGSGNNRGVSWYDNSVNDVTTGHWRYLQATNSGSFDVAKGYSVRPSSTVNFTFIGTGIYTADQTFALEQGVNNFNLVGNPFTAPLNLGDFFADNGAGVIAGAQVWFWDGNSYNVRTSGAHGSYEIAPGQGFFVEAAAETNLTFDVDDVSHTSSTFQKTLRTEIKLSLTEGSNTKNAYLYYINGTTTGYDLGYDGKLFGGVDHDLALYSNLISDDKGEKYQLQSLPASNLESMVIPLGIKASAGKEIIVSAESLNLPFGLKVFLEDRDNGSYTELTDTSDFKLKLKTELNGIGRFYLHTKSSSVLSASDFNVDNVSIYTLNNETLRLTGLPSGKASLKVFNILGKQMISSSFSSTGVSNVKLPTLSTGIYIVSLETVNGKLIKKIVLE